MSKKSNPTVIGAFVVGATILLAIAIALFGGAEVLAERNIYVTYFAQNTKGLRVGSNVLLNGVRVGHVSEMALFVDEKTFQSTTKVTIEVLPDSYIVTRDGKMIGEGMKSAVTHEELIQEGGLRATLAAESFVTGQLLLQLQFRPETEAVIRGDADSPHPEIPTIPSDIQVILEKIQHWLADLNEGLNAKELGQRIQNVLRGVDELANSQDLRKSLSS